jgi:hypothetical protein
LVEKKGDCQGGASCRSSAYCVCHQCIAIKLYLAATGRAIRKTDQWQKLAVGELKMDIDASFYEDGSGAIGTIS